MFQEKVISIVGQRRRSNIYIVGISETQQQQSKNHKSRNL